MERRNEIIRFLHQVTGPVVGLPALRCLFPDVPRCILSDLLRRYRKVWRTRYRTTGYRLTWHVAGAVWAIDHSQACYPIDGVYPYLFAVRDLASSRQLAWHPCESEGVEEVLPVLRDLFSRHGPPLVLKSDNGSAFIADRMKELLGKHEVAHLRLPPRTPSYNGGLERSNGVLKIYTKLHAARSGHPLRWTVEDLEAARTLANQISRPWGHQGPSPDEAWSRRDRLPIESRERFQFELGIQRSRLSIELGMRADESEMIAAQDTPRLDRHAIRATLEQLGYLELHRVKRAPRRRKRKSHAQIQTGMFLHFCRSKRVACLGH